MSSKLIGIAAIVVLIVLTGVVLTRKPASVASAIAVASPTPAVADNINPDSLSGIQTNAAPWPPETDHLKDRLQAIHLPALSQEGTALHTHEHLDIFIHRQHTPVPSGIGINKTAGFISPIHTHDATGIIHVESPTIRDYTLGQFFDIWGVRLTAACIGGYCTDSANTLLVFVDGQFYSQNPRDLVLKAHQEIVISFGTAKELPLPIPNDYSFPPDY